ncbi:hypothetical protein [Actinoplanes xinjiangensis]|uniref:hypothetical protein n=1 Tax=Actinoplanes xinjiangensis TaxID=512350 RepID=UPI000D6D5E43|nr:hypothetical protein [Actinoplanes xinjiangensis]GIF44219.1 hypothetical protein Axi01nite_85300 [Actinoplanes xinjiangensis]
MVERNDGQRPRLRIAGYVSGHAEPVAGPEPASVAEAGTAPRPRPPALPNISDYWPDRTRPAPEFETPAPGRSRRRKRPVIAAGLLAGLVITGTLLLTRPDDDPDRRDLAAPAATTPTTTPVTTAPVSIAPSATPTAAPTTTRPLPPPSPPPAERITAAKFELTTGVSRLDVRTADLDGDDFRVSTPKDSGLDVDADFDDGTLRVSAEPDGRENGSGRIDVLLSEDIVWRLRMVAGVHTASFDMAAGTVGDIDLIGGAQTVEIELGRLDRTLPILMAGGVHTWKIRTSGKVPVKLALSTGAGDVTLYGDEKGGVRAGTTIRKGDLGDEPGLNIDAEAGIGFLDVSRD